MKIILITLIIALIICASKWFYYMCSVRGLLYYISCRYGELLDEEDLKEITSIAMKWTIKDFFKIK
ncbi:MAG: hypothetical protein KIB00_17485 [Paeniclostridium sordellii]|nr:hypothetical protein [Paeniclostridium sordellii]